MPRAMLLHQPIDGGVGRHVADLATGLTERGWDVVLCGPSPPAPLDERLSHVRLDMVRAVARRDARQVLELARIARRVRPDILHAHSSKAGALARLARIAHPSLPVVYTPHGYAFGGHFSSAAERLAYREIERALARLANRVVCVCEAEARLARQVGPARRVRVVRNGVQPVVGNGVQLPADGDVDARIAGLRARGPVLCALTLLRAGKGLETLIDAMPLLLARHPGAQLAIAGDGPERESLLDRARARMVAESVHFVGPSSNPLQTLRGADVFVHPSWAESFPYVILEAMSLGLPIVASDVGGVSEALVDGESGVLVPARDTRSLADALCRLFDDPDLRARLGRTAEERVRSCFTRAKMIDGMQTVYEELLARPPARAPVRSPAAGTSVQL